LRPPAGNQDTPHASSVTGSGAQGFVQMTQTSAQPAATLRRELGRWDLTAIGVNQVIGGAIFLMPSQVAALVGGWSVVAFLFAGGASLLVALCLAEVGSRFEGTGGPYLYTRAAFGRFAGFEVGWMQWVTRATSHASVVNGVALAASFYFPAMAEGAGRAAIIVGLTTILAAVNVRGIRHSSFVVNMLTVGKLVPLALFVGVGLFFVDVSRLVPQESVSWADASGAALLLIFVFGGYDVVPVPAGEANDPRRHVPFALVMTILIVTAFMASVQLVALGTLPGLAESRTPLADSAALFIGAGGALLIGVGSLISMTGNLAGQVLTGSRMLFALAEQGELPRPLAAIHPRYRTPYIAIIFHAVVALALALSGSFVKLAAASAVARLVTYTGACASTLVLRREGAQAGVKPATFVVPLGPVVPWLAILVSMFILAGATRAQLTYGGLALAAGAVLFLASALRRRQ
jgi:basic amino acid/polyamine antiporter, APA family